MISSKTVFLVLFIFFGITACAEEASKMKFYVLVSEEKTTQFTQDVASLAKQIGFRSAVGQVSYGKGGTLYAVDAKKGWIWIAGGNVSLSGREDPAICGIYDEPHPDPGQFYVAIESLIPYVSRRRVSEITIKLKHELSELGYDVRDTPIMCSPLSKRAAE